MKQIPSLPSLKRTQRASIAAIFILFLLPAFLLGRALFLGEDYVPFDLTTFPPHSIELDGAELQERRDGANYDVTEKLAICSVEYRLARNEIIEGRFPHWNPYVRGGAPLFANSLDGFAYPTHWLFFAFDPDRAYGLVAWLAFCLAGVFMFGFLREIGLQILPSLFGAITFQLSGTLAANGHFFMRMETLIWLPAGFWALERLFKQSGVSRIPSLCAFAFSLAMTWLAGFPPFALPCSMAFGFYILKLGFRTFHERGRGPAATFLAWAGCAVFLGILIAGVQLLPMLDYFPESQRNLSPGSAQLAAQGMDPIAWLGFLTPSLFGSPLSSPGVPYESNPLVYLFYSRANPESGKLFFPANYIYTEYALYLGAFPLLCILLALLQPSVRFRYFATGGIVFFLLLAGGGLFFRIFSIFPFVASIPPMRYAGILCFFGAALAAMGLQVGPSTLSPRRRRALVAAAGSMLVVCLALTLWSIYLLSDPQTRGSWVLERISARWQVDHPVAADMGLVRSMFGGDILTGALRHFVSQAIYGTVLFGIVLLWVIAMPSIHKGAASYKRNLRRVLTGLALLITAIELLVLARDVNPSFPRREPADTPVHHFLRERAMEMRDKGGFMVARAASKPILQDALPPNYLVPLRVRDLNAYAFVDSRSHEPFQRIYGPEQMIREYWLKSFPADDRLKHGLFDLFGVRYLLSKEELPQLGKPVIPPLEGPSGRFFVYERTTALPRAFLVPRARIENNKENTLAFLCSEDYDPTALVLLHERYETTAGEESGNGNGNGGPQGLHSTQRPEMLEASRVSFRVDDPTHVSILIEDCPGAWLVLTDTAMSHWQATLNAGPVEWWRANHCFRALWIPAGEHQLDMTYDPHPFRRGLFTTAAALALILLLLAFWNGTPKVKPVKKQKDVVDIQSGTFPAVK